jgi:hypothetical protein
MTDFTFKVIDVLKIIYDNINNELLYDLENN